MNPLRQSRKTNLCYADMWVHIIFPLFKDFEQKSLQKNYVLSPTGND